uniref:hypothetical protein n=1 Tax=Candidatus Electrothrix sp. TaxID=2170559 RepID=UPI0040569013
MKRTVQKAWLVVIGAMLLYWLIPGIGFANVCSQGTGVPPFLSAGAKPKDRKSTRHSGSMLDAAYSKSGTILDENGDPISSSGGVDMTYQRCLDGDYDISEYDNQGNETVPPLTTVTGYDDSKTYGGYFEDDQWYQWKGKSGTYAYSSWQSGQSYEMGDRVFDYGNIYVAISAGTSSGNSIDEDEGVDWDHLFYLPRWTNGTVYAAGAFVWYENQLYYTANGGTSSDTDDTDGLKLSDDTGVTDWVEVDSTWMPTSYATGDIVTYNGIYYQALSSVSSTDAKPGEDNGAKWQSLRQGAFEEIDPVDACSGAASSDTKYKRTDALCLSIDETVTPNKVTTFAARGNFLNWVMASKFDVEKKILTGGKFNYYEQVMVAEHRGCSGSRFLKQVKLDSGKFLSLGVRGSKYSADDVFMRDRVDTTDDTARLEILAITADGFKPSAECQEMIDTITTKVLSGANWSQAIDTCLDTFPDADGAIAQQRPMLNHSLQFCASLSGNNTRNVTTITNECEGLYTETNQSPAYEPSELEPENGAYICFGIYDAALSQTERAGYVGRCWKPAQGEQKTCETIPASLENKCSGDPCTYTDNGELYLNETPTNGSIRYNYKCTSTSGQLDEFGCKKHNSDVAGDRSYWERQYKWYYPDFGVYIGSCMEGEVAEGATSADWENADDSTAVEECIVQASIDYCNDTSIPEVIDPSDQAGDTTTTWNIPGVLTDSQVLAQLGGTNPLATMKGYIAETDRPEGIIQSVAQDLRLGAMSFHNVGAATECSAEYLTDGIERFCPVENKDGAELLVALKDGELVTASNDSTYASGKRRHVDDLAQAINDIRATSWTPLGEAMYGALGYYTQNEEFCLNFDNNGKCLDWCLETDSSGNCTDPADDDPVQYWCQDNHILLITEGESTADINTKITAFAPTGTEDYVNTRSITCECHPDNMDAGQCKDDVFTGDGGTTDTECTGSLYSSTYLDDMTWWGQNIRSLYKDRCVADPDGRETEKDNIFTHVVTTGSLTEGGDGECDPATLMQAAAVNGGTTEYYPGEDPDDLEDNLMAVLDDILSRASSGSAASVISSSRSGSGAVYQAVFWPEYEYEDTAGDTQQIAWVGNVHSLFMSAEGKMYEDTNHDGKLDETQDRRVMFYFSNTVNKTRGCYDINEFILTGTCPDDSEPECDATPTDEGGAGHSCAEINDINYLWSANNYLESLSDADVHTARKIFTWNDANNDGMVDDAEWFRLKKNVDWDTLNGIAAATADDDVDGNERGPVSWDFLTPGDTNFVRDDGGTDLATISGYENDALNALIGWLHGEDQANTENLVDGDVNLNDRIDKELRSRYYEKNGIG